MQLWVFLFGTVACVALSGATPLAEVKEASEELLDHHEIQKRQLEVVNAASGLSKFMVENTERQSMAVFTLYLFFGLSVCDLGIPILEDKVENLNIPSFSTSGTDIYR